MGSDAAPEAGGYVNQLANHARRLQREARSAIASGDYDRAAALIGDAELLAEDVHDLVDDFEERQTGTLMGLAVQAQAAAAPRAPRRRAILPPHRRRRFAMGASLAMSLALVEC